MDIGHVRYNTIFAPVNSKGQEYMFAPDWDNDMFPIAENQARQMKAANKMNKTIVKTESKDTADIMALSTRSGRVGLHRSLTSGGIDFADPSFRRVREVQSKHLTDPKKILTHELMHQVGYEFLPTNFERTFIENDGTPGHATHPTMVNEKLFRSQVFGGDENIGTSEVNMVRKHLSSYATIDMDELVAESLTQRVFEPERGFGKSAEQAVMHILKGKEKGKAFHELDATILYSGHIGRDSAKRAYSGEKQAASTLFDKAKKLPILPAAGVALGVAAAGGYARHKWNQSHNKNKKYSDSISKGHKYLSFI